MAGHRRDALVLFAWLAACGFTVACLIFTLQGELRDTRWGQPSLSLDPASSGEERTEGFRIWRDGTYELFLRSDNDDPSRAGWPLSAAIEVTVTDPAGRAAFARLYAPGDTGHHVPRHRVDTALAELQLEGSPWRTWTLAARVIRDDGRFAGVPTELKLWRERRHPDGPRLVSYAMMTPAGVGLAITLALALALVHRGKGWPLLVSLPLTLALVALYIDVNGT